MSNLSIRMKIMTSLGGLAAGYIFLLGIVLWNTSIATGYFDQMGKSLHPASINSQDAKNDLQNATEHYKQAVVQQDLRELILADRDMGDLLQSLSMLKQFYAGGNPRQNLIDQTIAAAGVLRLHAKATYPAMIANPDKANESTLQAVALLAVDIQSLTADVATLRLNCLTDGDVALEGVIIRSRRSRIIGICVMLLAAVWVFGSIFIFQKQIVLPIEVLSARLREIAEGDGDLTKRLQVARNDELGQVASSFNVFMDQLQSIVRQVALGALHLATATTDIAATSAQTIQLADLQENEAEQIAVAMHEMASSVADVSRSSHSAAEKAHHAVALAKQGGAAVQEVISRMQVVTGSAEEAGAQMTELGLRSKQIGKIVVLISDITTQTNLLALNAAIEAARAGEHGRGFGVVAGEVRNLADRTAKATDQISEMIMVLQAGTDAAVQTMRHSTAQVQLGMEAATSTGDSFRRIIEAVEQGADMITRVAGATTQQAIGTDGVNDNVGRIAIMTKESAVGAKKSADAVAELATLAIHLKQMISNFRLEGEVSDSAVIETTTTKKRSLRLARA
jgi:methyl-accepting chemotaxis protein